MRDMGMLHPELQEKLTLLLSICKDKKLNIKIGECLRTVAEQDDLYAQGRWAPGNIVTYARGITYSSQHQWGIAADFFENVPGHEFDNETFFRRVGRIAKSLGLGWGGDWVSPVDMPHLYLPYWGDTPAPLKRQYTTPENFFRTWSSYKKEEEDKKLEVDGWCGPATVRRLQEVFGTTVDGIISDQWIWYKDQNPGLCAVEWVTKPTHGSMLVRALQEYAGANVDGVIGPETIKCLQCKFGTYVDGCVSGPSQLIMAIQDWLNKQ